MHGPPESSQAPDYATATVCIHKTFCKPENWLKFVSIQYIWIRSVYAIVYRMQQKWRGNNHVTDKSYRLSYTVVTLHFFIFASCKFLRIFRLVLWVNAQELHWRKLALIILCKFRSTSRKISYSPESGNETTRYSDLAVDYKGGAGSPRYVTINVQ